MKQTVEEAAKEYYEGNNYTPFISTIMNDLNISHNKVDVESIRQHHLKKGFIAGAEWQSKQSPWISVKDKAGCDSSNDCIVMVMNGDVFRAYFSSKDKWIKKDGGSYDEVIDDVVAWMPIPSFDEILEANRDVLERIKEKGD